MKLATIGATAALLMLSCSPSALAATDEEFLKTAIGINLAEIDMGKMASEKGESSEVKIFGQTLIDDHMKSNDEAKKLASSMKIEPPTEPSDEAKKAAEEAGTKEGADFDKAFADHMVMGHEEAIALFKDKADDADNEVSTFAKNTLPTLEKHLETAQSLKKGESVAAANGASSGGAMSGASTGTRPMVGAETGKRPMEGAEIVTSQPMAGAAPTPGASNATDKTGGAASPMTPSTGTADSMAQNPPSEVPTSSGQAVQTNKTTATAPTTTPQNEPATAPEATPSTTTTDSAANATARPEGLKLVETGTISSETLIGTTVYGANDDTLGEVSDVILAKEGSEGSIEAILVDVGGFLGIGAKPVALALSDLEIMTDADGDYYVYSKFSKEQLENAPEFDKATFDQNRDRMILRSTQ